MYLIVSEVLIKYFILHILLYYSHIQILERLIICIFKYLKIYSFIFLATLFTNTVNISELDLIIVSKRRLKLLLLKLEL